MQLFDPATIRDPAGQVAGRLLAALPAFLKFVRSQMRGRRGPSLTVPQFRALVFVRHHPPARLAALAEHVGIALPSASRLVDGLVRREMLIRAVDPFDRRALTIELTPLGRRVVDRAWSGTLSALASHVRCLPRARLAELSRSLSMLQEIFPSPVDAAPSSAPVRRTGRGSHPSRPKESA